jgi:hypothetical protein
MLDTGHTTCQNHQRQSKPQERLGAVARDKYEGIIRDRISARIRTLEKQLDPHRDDALHEHLRRVGLNEKLTTCRALFKELNTAFAAETYVRPYWIEEDGNLFGVDHIRRGVDQILSQKAVIKPLFDEIDRLREIESQVREKVWLAGAPSETTLLDEIGDAKAATFAIKE